MTKRQPQLRSRYRRKPLVRTRDNAPGSVQERRGVRRLMTAGGHPAWEELVLQRLGRDPVPAEGLTNFLRCVLVHVFRHGHAPDGQPWCHSPGAATGALLDSGHLRKTDGGLELTDSGLAAAGVLEPVSTHLHAGQWLASDSEAYAVLIGPVRERTQTIVRLVEVGA